MTSEELKNEVFKILPFVSANIADSSYAVMTKESFMETSKYMKWLLSVFNVFGWEAKFDCDDFAMTWKMMTSLRHAKASQGRSEGVACGVVWYVSDKTGNGHAINLVKTEDGWEFFEPQTAEFVKLSDEERTSVCFVLF